ncbi:MAG: hypothetical protein ACFFD4_37825 [Candidatus Odinarchaeota archaeon]
MTSITHFISNTDCPSREIERLILTLTARSVKSSENFELAFPEIIDRHSLNGSKQLSYAGGGYGY